MFEDLKEDISDQINSTAFTYIFLLNFIIFIACDVKCYSTAGFVWLGSGKKVLTTIGLPHKIFHSCGWCFACLPQGRHGESRSSLRGSPLADIIRLIGMGRRSGPTG
jgi:hypothetical protein